MPTWSNYLSLDLGAESGRIFLVRTDGRHIETKECHRYQNEPVLVNGHLHWDYLKIFEELKKGITKAWALAGNDVTSLAIDTWGTDFGFINRKGEVVGLPFAYRDQKDERMIEEVRKQIPDDELYSLTGTQIMKVNTLYQFLAIIKSDSPPMKAVEKMLFLPDLFNFLFCGRRVTEYTIASTTQLLDPVKKTWQQKIFSRLGLPFEIMPEIVGPGTLLGKILPEQAAEMEVPGLVVRTCASHDTASAVVAAPVIPDGKPWAFISSGTWSLVGTEVTGPILNNEAFRANFTNEGGVCDTIRFLKNLTGMWLIQQLKSSLAFRGIRADYPNLISAAESTTPFQRFINTEDPTFNNPPDMVTAIENYLTKTRQPKAVSPIEYARCIFESLAYKYSEVIALLTRVTGKKFDRVYVIGGGARNDLLNSFTADASGLKVMVGPYEATAIGNGLIQAMADGIFKSLTEARVAVKNSFEVKTFKPRVPDEWNKNYEHYKEVTKLS